MLTPSQDVIATENFVTLSAGSYTDNEVPRVDTGDAAFSITGTSATGEILSATLDRSDPDGDGSFSYQWQSSINGETWTDINGAIVKAKDGNSRC